jgi:hypothetical protein
MPYFYFDLVVGEEFKDQGGMILEDTQIAFEKADSLASELYIVRPELRFARSILPSRMSTPAIVIPSDRATASAERIIARSIGVSEPNSTATRRIFAAVSLSTLSHLPHGSCGQRMRYASNA